MKKGFTLIELLVVVLIIGILAAIAVPQYQKAVERSRTAEALVWLGNFQTAASIYFMQNPDGLSFDLSDWRTELENGSGIGLPKDLKGYNMMAMYQYKNGTKYTGVFLVPSSGNVYYNLVSEVDDAGKPFGPYCTSISDAEEAKCKSLGFSAEDKDAGHCVLGRANASFAKCFLKP